MDFAFFDPIVNPQVVTYSILNGPGSPNIDRARTLLSRFMNVAPPLTGEYQAGHIRDVQKARDVLVMREHPITAPERLAYLAYFGGRAMHLLTICSCNAMPAVDYHIRSGDVEEEASCLADCLDEIINQWEPVEHTQYEQRIHNAAKVWTTQLRRLTRSSDAIPDDGANLLMRRLRETYDDQIILAPISDGWAVCSWPTGRDVSMQAITSGDTPEAAALDALTQAPK